MALIDKASLLMVPSTYEAGTLYNVLPSGNRAPDSTDQNSGYDQTRADFDFDRGSNASATRIGSDGLLKKYRENLLVQSNQFDTTWVNYQSAETGGQPDKDGRNTAWKLTRLVDGANSVIYQTGLSYSLATFSVYAKAAEENWIYIEGVGSTYPAQFFDLQNGVKGTASGVGFVDSSITSVGGGWYRISITFNISGGNRVSIYQATANNTLSGSIGDGVYIMNAQVEKSLVASSYLDSTSVTGKAGVLVDLPRINYDANGQNGALLLEPSRANLIDQSEYFGAWTFGSGITLTHNHTTSPEGLKNATLLARTTSGNVQQSKSVTSGTTYAISVFAKAGTSNIVNISATSSLTTSVTQFDLSDQSITTTTGSVVDSDIEDYGNGWYRCWIIQTAISTGTGQVRINTGDNVNIVIWGAMLETGNYVSSYIPTMGTSETRAADDMDTTFATPIQTNGSATIFFHELGVPDSDDISTTGGAYRYGKGSNNYVSLTTHPSTWRVRVQSGGSSNFQTLSFDYLKTDPIKIAVVVTSTTYSIYANGNAIVENQSMSATADFSSIENFTSIIAENVGVRKSKQHIVFAEALSSAECVTLTTL